MKIRALSLLLLLSSSGCLFRRELVIGTPAAVEPDPGLSAETTWRLGEVHVAVEAQNANGSAQPLVLDLAPLKQQIGDRLRATLLAQSNLGARTGPAAYALEVNLEARERYGFGRQIGLSIALEVGLAAIGALVGALVGNATTRPPDWLVGYSVGAGAGLGAGVIASTLPEAAGTQGNLKATLVLRRLSDRVPVAQRSIESAWRADYNFYDIPSKLARASGVGMADFEKVLVPALKDMLLELQPAPPAPAAP